MTHDEQVLTIGLAVYGGSVLLFIIFLFTWIHIWDSLKLPDNQTLRTGCAICIAGTVMFFIFDKLDATKNNEPSVAGQLADGSYSTWLFFVAYGVCGLVAVFIVAPVLYATGAAILRKLFSK